MFVKRYDVGVQTDMGCRRCSEEIIQNKRTYTVYDEKTFNSDASMLGGLQFVIPDGETEKTKLQHMQAVSKVDDLEQSRGMLNHLEKTEAPPISTSIKIKAKGDIRIRNFANDCLADNIVTLDESREEGEITDDDEANENKDDENGLKRKETGNAKEKEAEEVAEMEENTSETKSTRQPISFKITEPNPKKLRLSRFEPVNTLQQRLEAEARKLEKKIERATVGQRCQSVVQINNNDNEHILTTLDNNINIQTYTNYNPQILTNFNGQVQSNSNKKEGQMQASTLASTPHAYGQIQTNSNETSLYEKFQTYHNIHAPQFQVDFRGRNTKDANINAHILTSPEDAEVMPIFGKPIKHAAKDYEYIETHQSDTNCKPIFGKPIKKEAKCDEYVETYQNDNDSEPIFGSRRKEDIIPVAQKEIEKRREEQSNSKRRPQMPSRREERKLSKSRERSKSGSCRKRVDLRKRWNTERSRAKVRRDRSRSRTNVGRDRSRSRTNVGRDRSRSRTKRDRSKSILFVQKKNRSRSRSRRMDRNKDCGSRVKDRSRSRTYKHSRNNQKRHSKDRPRNKTFREQRRSPSRTVGYEKTTITTFKREITTSRSRKSSNRAKSIEWQEDRVVREMSCDSIKKEPVLQSNRVVREISIDRYKEEHRSNYAANTFELNRWTNNDHDDLFLPAYQFNTTDDVSAVTTLQELCKRKGWDPPRFSVIRMTEDSRPRYIYMVSVDGKQYEYRGKSFHSQHIAKEHCAKSCLVKLRFNHPKYF